MLKLPTKYTLKQVRLIGTGPSFSYYWKATRLLSKYYSRAWCTWPTPLKKAESKIKYTKA